MTRVFAAISGGVDSSVAAALLQEQGYQVIGGTMTVIPDYVSSNDSSPATEAAAVAEKLNIPHYSFDLRKSFQSQVIDNFVEEYRNGRTPNPCVICNKKIKFDIMLKKALELDCDYIATGHYAKIVHNDQGRHLLKKAEDRHKDQSYMLYGLNQFQLGKTLMPLGEYSKSEVREKARKLGFSNSEKEESQDICFVPHNNYSQFLENYYSGFSQKGPIYNTEGKKLGEHQGLHNYTIGQRRGLGISLPYPVYVVEIDTANNALIVGKNKEVFSQKLVAENLNWIPFAELEEPKIVRARIRYNARAVAAAVFPGDDSDNEAKTAETAATVNDNEVKVVFKNKQRAVTPGQSVVFYDKDLVVGGGIIKN